MSFGLVLIVILNLSSQVIVSKRVFSVEFFFFINMAKQTSLDTRELVLKLHKDGKSLREIAKIINRNHNTVKKLSTSIKIPENCKILTILVDHVGLMKHKYDLLYVR